MSIQGLINCGGWGTISAAQKYIFTSGNPAGRRADECAPHTVPTREKSRHLSGAVLSSYLWHASICPSLNDFRVTPPPFLHPMALNMSLFCPRLSTGWSQIDRATVVDKILPREALSGLTHTQQTFFPVVCVIKEIWHALPCCVQDPNHSKQNQNTNRAQARGMQGALHQSLLAVLPSYLMCTL